MNKRSIIFILSILCLPIQTALAEDTSGDLALQVAGITNDRGQVLANLFRESDDVMKPDQAYLQARTTISGNRAQLVFKNLKYGKYAVIVFHDENSNSTLDHNFLRVPAEPLGFSNNFHLGMFSGFPNFEKLQFEFKPGIETISIMVK